MSWERDFDRLAPYIEAALGYTGGTHTLDDVRRGIADGRLQFWPASDSFIITEIALYPTGLKVVNFWLAGGHLDELEPLLYIVEGWAKEQGCSTATCTGRRGWERSFLTKAAGWTPALTFYAKELA